jgi:hypothetical protein
MRGLTVILATLILLGTSAPRAAAATGEHHFGVQTAAQLRPWLAAAEMGAVAAAFALPLDTPYSVALAEQLVPGWQPLRLKLQKLQVGELNGAGPAHRAWRRLDAFAKQVRPGGLPVPAIGAFSLERYMSLVAMFAGQTSLPWPGLPDRMVRFTNRLMGHPDNQLAEVCDYLKATYQAMGLPVEEQTFQWAGRPYRNVIVTIPGESDESVLLVDHIDTADIWDYPPESLQELSAYGLSAETIAAIRARHRVDGPAPGADDNASATAALMEAGRLFAGKKPARTIKLLHLNGEELPGDCAGARHYVAGALQRAEKIAAVVVMDMIGVNRQRDRVFQISAGRHPHSLALADMALNASKVYAQGLKPVIRSSESPLSYLYNTDGIVFSLAGYPVILLNEHLNHEEDLNRLGYHDEFDRPELMDRAYAQAIASVGLATALQAASGPSALALDGRLRATMQEPAFRVGDFQIELAISPLYAAMVAAEKALGRPLTDAELSRQIADDRKLDGDEASGAESVANRVTHWFAESGLTPIGDTAIIAELRHLRLRELMAKPGPAKPH